MERLTIKELAPYLPYDLKGVDYFQGHRLIRDITLHNVMAIVDGDTKLKPLLRPLSSLTEERTDSQYSTLIEQIVKEAEQHCDAYDEWLEIFIDDPDPSRILQAPYEVVQELLAQKFDVFGLIGRDLALPINEKEVEE